MSVRRPRAFTGFADRVAAGRALAEALAEHEALSSTDAVVLALPRGGVPVAYELARQRGWTLDVFVARKIGAPGNPEYAIGAIAEGGPAILRASASRLGLSRADIVRAADDARLELARRITHYRGERTLEAVADRAVLLVDDGIATGATAEAALRSLRAMGPRSLVLATPVCAPDAAARLGRIADDVVAVHRPAHFHAVGQWYDDFAPTSDDEVLDLLARARTRG